MATRTYTCQDVELLYVCKTINQSFKTCLPDLSTVRSNWTQAYADELDLRIDNGFELTLGTDVLKNLRAATSGVTGIQAPAMSDLSLFKTQIDADFKKDPATRDEILLTLGFSAYLHQVQNKSQGALTNLLFQFKTNLSPELRAQITEKGMSPALIDRIIGYANPFSQANTLQESLKGTTKELTHEGVLTFNGLYDEIISICKIASNFYRNDPLKKEQFTFSKVLAKLRSSSKPATGETTPEA
jgi:hypothetical protein